MIASLSRQTKAVITRLRQNGKAVAYALLSAPLLIFAVSAAGCAEEEGYYARRYREPVYRANYSGEDDYERHDRRYYDRDDRRDSYDEGNEE